MNRSEDADRPRTRSRVRVGVVAVLVVVAGVVVLWSVQRHLTYFPAGQPPPVDQVLAGGQDVQVTTADGLELQAWWVDGGATTAVLVLPGNAGNRAARAPLAAALRRMGLSVLLLDYRGYGGNPGTPSQAGLLADGRAAWDWLAARPDVDRVVLFGESLGAAVAVGLARDRDPAALVLRSPFTSLADMARLHFGPVPGWFLRDPYPVEEWIGAVDAPVLVVASDADDIVPFRFSRRVHDAAPAPRRLVRVDDVGHNDRGLLDGHVLVDAVRSHLDAHGLLPPG